LPIVYLITGLCTILCGPLIGRAADTFGKAPVFTVGTAVSIVMVLVFTHLGPTSLPMLILVNALLFVGIFSRMIPYQAFLSTIPSVTQRGSFSSINSSVQQISGGLASVLAGHIVTFGADGKLQHIDVVGYTIVGTSLLTLCLIWYQQPRRAAIAAVAQ